MAYIYVATDMNDCHIGVSTSLPGMLAAIRAHACRCRRDEVHHDIRLAPGASDEDDLYMDEVEISSGGDVWIAVAFVSRFEVGGSDA